MRAPIVLISLFGLTLSLIYLTTSYLHRFTLGWLAHLMGLIKNVDDGRVLCSAAILLFFIVIVFYVFLSLMRRGTAVEGVIARFVGDRGAFYDFLSTFIQWGRFLYYEKDIYLIVYISIVFLIVVMFFDLFARRADTIVIARKVAKRCFFGALILVYQKQMFDKFPGAIVPLPALLAGYILVFCSEDMPQHLLVPNWYNWRIPPFHADVE